MPPVEAPLSRLAPEAPARMSLHFQSVDVRQVLQAIADFSGFNVVASDNVGGEVTVWLTAVHWRQALQAVLDAKQLGYRERDGILWVAPRADILQHQQDELAQRLARRQLAPLSQAVFRLHYAKAQTLAQQLRAAPATRSATKPAPGKDQARDARGEAIGRGLLSERGFVLVDERTNQLFVTDTAPALRAVRALIQAVDVPLRQVLIEARIIEADGAFSRHLGVRLGVGNAAAVSLGPRLAIGPTYGAVTAAGGGASAPFVNLPAGGIGGADAASFAVALFGASAARMLSLEVSALEADGRGKIVSSPRIVTADQIKAVIEQGTEYPYQTVNADGATSVAFRQANLKLEVVPQITPDGQIILDVDIHKDSRGETTAAGMAINTKHVQTQVRVEDGGTLVIGGILEAYERVEVSKVPGLGDLPVIGNVFQSSRRQRDQAEVVVLLTPRVINQATLGNTRDRTGGDARIGQIDHCPPIGQAPGRDSCRQ